MDPTVIERIKPLTRGVAHRGYHDLTRPENSRAAFIHAIECGLPFECDIHLSMDGALVVCHDSDLIRMCGKPGIIEELTLTEIQNEYRYSDGSCPITLQELLSLNPGNIPMVLELKAYKGNAKHLAEVAVPVLNAIPNIEQCVAISFSKEALTAARECGIKMPVGYLISTEAVKQDTEEDLMRFDFLDVEVHYSLLPRFRRYRKKGGVILCWTVKSRLTYWIGKHRADGITWEIVDSAKDKNKVNRFLQRRLG